MNWTIPILEFQKTLKVADKYLMYAHNLTAEITMYDRIHKIYQEKEWDAPWFYQPGESVNAHRKFRDLNKTYVEANDAIYDEPQLIDKSKTGPKAWGDSTRTSFMTIYT
jgi:hypothetical protein